MKTDEAETKRNSLHGETEKSFFWNGKSLALQHNDALCPLAKVALPNLGLVWWSLPLVLFEVPVRP